MYSRPSYWLSGEQAQKPFHSPEMQQDLPGNAIIHWKRRTMLIQAHLRNGIDDLFATTALWMTEGSGLLAGQARLSIHGSCKAIDGDGEYIKRFETHLCFWDDHTRSNQRYVGLLKLHRG